LNQVINNITIYASPLLLAYQARRTFQVGIINKRSDRIDSMRPITDVFALILMEMAITSDFLVSLSKDDFEVY